MRTNLSTPRYRVAVVLGVGLGLREGEAFGLTVHRVDFLRRKIHVLSQAQRGQLAADLKTEASTRTIPADEWVLNGISTHVRRFGTGPDEVIVTNQIGKVAQRNAFGYCWRQAVADARICGANRGEPQPQSDPGPPRARHHHRNDGHLRAPFPDAEDLGRGAIDAVFAMALTEHRRNQDIR